MANHLKDNPLKEKNSQLDDELDGFRKAVKQKLKEFICFSSAKSPAGSSTESAEFSSTKTALNATAYSTKTALNAKAYSTKMIYSDAIVNSKPELNAAASRDENSELTLHVSEDDNNIYKFTNPKRGLAVIINNENFSLTKDFSDRPGSSFDAIALEDTFQRLGFEILLENNLTAKQMTLLLSLVSQKYDHVNADCFVCVILSHGDETWITREFNKSRSTERHDLLFGVDGKAVASKAVVETFNDDNCPTLKGKPRLFFFQACRGTKLDDGTDIRVTNDQAVISRNTETSSSSIQEKDDSFSEQNKAQSKEEKNSKSCSKNDLNDDLPWSYVHDVPVSPAPLYKDCLVMYATPPGFLSWRRQDSGSWFIQSLCRMLGNSKVRSGGVTLLKVLTQVSGQVAKYYESNVLEDPSSHRKKEEPVVYCMLVKEVVLKMKMMETTPQNLFFANRNQY